MWILWGFDGVGDKVGVVVEKGDDGVVVLGVVVG